MNTNTVKKIAFAVFALVATCALSSAANYTWAGSSGDWSDGTKWTGGTAPSGAGHHLFFDGAAAQTSNNDSQLTQLNGIYFNAGAGAFTLTGTSLILNLNNFVNNSTNKQTVNLNLVLNGDRTVNTKYGDVTINGVVSNNGTNRLFRKEGQKTLELSGNNTWGGRTSIDGGTLLLDASTGNITTETFWFGQYNIGNTGAFEVKGGDYTTSASLNFLSYSANTVKANANVAITFGSLVTVATGTAMKFDTSGSGSSISFSTKPSESTGRILNATVKDSTGKTSFANTVQNGDVYTLAALTGLTDLSTNPSTSINSNAYLNLTNGSYNNNTVDRNLSSLTLQGAGEGTVTVTGNSLRLREILMQEETGNYTFDIDQSRSSPSYQLLVHQHSANGILTFNGKLSGDSDTGGFSKSGAGTVIISGSSSSAFTGNTYVQKGTLELDGTLSGTRSVRIYDGATLAGGGSIGSHWTTIVEEVETDNYTAMEIYAGGRIAGTSSGALDITGTVNFQSDSIFAFTLGVGTKSVDVSRSVTLQNNVALELTLNGAPALYTPLYLLTSGTGITGSFVYNNTVMTNGTAFSLGGYDFTYFQDSTDIWVQAIPEPSAALLFALGAASLLLRRRGTFTSKTSKETNA